MGTSRALVKRGGGNAALARSRAERKLSRFKTVLSRIRANDFLSWMTVLNTVSLCLLVILAVSEYRLVSLGVFDPAVFYCLIFVNIPLAVLVYPLIIWASKDSLRARLEADELKRLNAENDMLVAHKRLCMQNPGDEEFERNYEELLRSIKQSREEES